MNVSGVVDTESIDIKIPYPFIHIFTSHIVLKMVRLHLKKGNESLFLHDTTVQQDVSSLTAEVVTIYDLRLKVLRLCEGDQLIFCYYTIKLC